MRYRIRGRSRTQPAYPDQDPAGPALTLAEVGSRLAEVSARLSAAETRLAVVEERAVDAAKALEFVMIDLNGALRDVDACANPE